MLQLILSLCGRNSLGRLRRVSHRLKSEADRYVRHLPKNASDLRVRWRGPLCDGEYILAVTSDRFGSSRCRFTFTAWPPKHRRNTLHSGTLEWSPTSPKWTACRGRKRETGRSRTKACGSCYIGVVLQDQIELGPSLSDKAFATTLFPLWL